MSSSRDCRILAGLLMLSACNGQHTADQIAVNGVVASDETVEDADTRADRLAEKASLLNAEAAQVTGARRQALENEADADLTVAVGVERQGQADADNITAASENEIGESRRR